MTFKKSVFDHGNEILFLSIVALVSLPAQYKLPGLAIFCLSLITAAFIDWKKNTKRVRRISRRVASCSCEKARETIAHMQVPQMLQTECTVCSAEAA